MEGYLRETNPTDLSADQIQQTLERLANLPESGLLVARASLGQLDRDTLARLLSQQGLSEYQVNQAIDLVLDATRSAVRAPQRLATRARDQVQDVQRALTEYLRNTDRAELNPGGIRRDLRLLLNQPREGLAQWRERFSQVDRGTLVSLLAQRDDFSEEEANQIVEQIDAVRQEFLQQAQQAQSKVQDTVQSAIDDVLGYLRSYLNALDQPEPNYDGIKRDMRTLFDDPEAGFEALSLLCSRSRKMPAYEAA